MRVDTLHKIADKVSEIPRIIDRNGGDGLWTHHVKKCVLEIGIESGFRVCTSGFKGLADEEWLYDLVWFKNTDDPYLKEVGLVLESEWAATLGAIRYDFEKLHLANAPLKVLVCQSGSKTFESMKEHFSRSIAAYDRIQGDSLYLILIFMNPAYEFEHCILDAAGNPV